jgi:Ca2+-binding EF-hand superfamily protein
MSREQHHSGIRPEIAGELQENFDNVDSNEDGRIDFGEFKLLLENLEAQMSETDLRIGFREIDTDHDGCISLGELAAWWSLE